MSRKLKVWGGALMSDRFPEYKQYRVIVAATTKKEAVERLSKFQPISATYFSTYWCETGNKKELETAVFPGIWRQQKPGVMSDSDYLLI